MDKREQIIEALEMSYRFSNVDENNTLVPQEIVLDIIALLKAQEPVKPYKINGRWFRSWHCGACGGFLGEVNNQKVDYCYHCGRAVKWE